MADLRRRVEVGGDLGGDGIVLDADHHGVLGGLVDECSTAAARFEYTATGESGAHEGLPDCGGHGGVGVVGVEDRGFGLAILGVGEQFA
ncbi:hypothetical protein OKHIL_76430 [Mycolicibacterium mageritense]